MGKRLITQRRGKGSLTYKSPEHRYHYQIELPITNEKLIGNVVDLIKDPARSAPTAVVKFSNNFQMTVPAPLGVRIGDEVNYNDNSIVSPLSVLQLMNIPEGTLIYNIESSPGDNGKFCRSAGTVARIITKTNEYVLVELPSKKQRKFNPKCRAIIGMISGGGRTEKPILKAGKKHHMMRAKNKLYPKTSGVAMNAVDHPFGSGRGRHVGKPKTPPKNAPPGRNIGLIRARRTGRKR